MSKLIGLDKVNLRIFSLATSMLLACFVFMSCKDQVSKEEKDTSNLQDVKEKNSTVISYIEFINSDTNKMTLNHNFTHEALLKLGDATSAMAKEIGFNVQSNMDQVKLYADKIVQDPLETTHADNIRKATDLISTVIQNMQSASYPELSKDAAALKSASMSINPDILTLDQKDSVKLFFKTAANILDKMN